MHPVLMYHAIGSGPEIAGADPHYAVAEAAFAAQIAVLGTSVALARQVGDGAGIQAPCITFDDGHVSNYRIALPILLAAGLGAEFYVNSATVGRRGQVSWSELREMAAHGMSVQSHAHHHVLLSDLAAHELRAELEVSKKTIEDRLGQPVVVLAPPGGRYNRLTVAIAEELGYRRLAVSRPGLWQRFDAPTVPRFPIYASTSTATVLRYRRRWSRDTLRARLRYQLTQLGQQALGNRRYERLRNAVVASTP